MRLSRCLSMRRSAAAAATSWGVAAAPGREGLLAVGGRPAAWAAAVMATSAAPWAQQRRGCSGAPPAQQQTQLGAYLERSGARWSNVAEVQDVVVTEGGRSLSWRVDLPPERLAALRHGDLLESKPFDLAGIELRGRPVKARFQLFPKGDAESKADGSCSLWLCLDSRVRVPGLRLRIGSVEREAGASEFCRLEEALQSGSLEVGLELPAEAAETAKPEAPAQVMQSLRLTGLQAAEWQVHNLGELFAAGQLVSSPPFRFHHVLLGDMYLELLPGTPHAEHCTLFFRCRVPSMRLRVSLAVGEAFQRSFEAVGRNSVEQDLASSQCLSVNLSAPSVLGPDGSLTVMCHLEEVVKIPAVVRDMIPRLDERAAWPKRL